MQNQPDFSKAFFNKMRVICERQIVNTTEKIVTNEQSQALKADESDKLAQRMRTSASQALAAWNKFLSLPDDVDLERGLSLDEVTLISSHNTVANPAAILSLLSEREADKALIAEQDKRLVEYARIATDSAKRVAELESRTLTVKLPPSIDCSNAHFAIRAGRISYRDEVIKELESACAAAGITLVVGE